MEKGTDALSAERLLGERQNIRARALAPHDGNAAKKKTFSPYSVNVQAEAPKILRLRGRLKGEGTCGGILKGFLK